MPIFLKKVNLSIAYARRAAMSLLMLLI